MSPKVQDGRPLREGVIKAADQAADIKGERLMDGTVPLTPAQQRALAEDKWPDDAEAPPGYEAGQVVVTDPNRPARPRDEAQPLDAWSRIDGEGEDRKETPAAESESDADAQRVQQQAQKLREDFKAHLPKVRQNAEQAIRSGRPDAAINEVTKTVALAAELKKKGIL